MVQTDLVDIYSSIELILSFNCDIIGSTSSIFKDATFLYKDEAIKKASCELNIICYSLELLPNNTLITLSHHEKKFIKFSLSVTNKVRN